MRSFFLTIVATVFSLSAASGWGEEVKIALKTDQVIEQKIPEETEFGRPSFLQVAAVQPPDVFVNATSYLKAEDEALGEYHVNQARVQLGDLSDNTGKPPQHTEARLTIWRQPYNADGKAQGPREPVISLNSKVGAGRMLKFAGDSEQKVVVEKYDRLYIEVDFQDPQPDEPTDGTVHNKKDPDYKRYSAAVKNLPDGEALTASKRSMVVLWKAE